MAAEENGKLQLSNKPDDIEDETEDSPSARTCFSLLEQYDYQKGRETIRRCD